MAPDCDVLRIELSGSSVPLVMDASREVDLTPREYVTLALNVCAQLPPDMLMCLAAGVPVHFSASAFVGEGV